MYHLILLKNIIYCLYDYEYWKKRFWGDLFYSYLPVWPPLATCYNQYYIMLSIHNKYLQHDGVVFWWLTVLFCILMSVRTENEDHSEPVGRSAQRYSVIVVRGKRRRVLQRVQHRRTAQGRPKGRFHRPGHSTRGIRGQWHASDAVHYVAE